MIQADAVAYIGALVWRFPELRDSFAEHLADNDGEVLPHVFMSEIERWAESLIGVQQDRLAELLTELDSALDAANDDVSNVIDVSFVEHLPYPEEANAEIREMLPVRLRALLRHGL